MLVNDDDLTYAKIRLDERSLATLVEHVGDFTESLPRALCWAAAWDMTRDAEMPARDYVSLVLAGLGGETDIGVVQSLLRQAQSAVTLFADPAWAPDGPGRLAARGRTSAVRAADAGQRPAAGLGARARLAGRAPPEQVALLRGLLDGAPSVPGLAVDADLRWHLLHRLVVARRGGRRRDRRGARPRPARPPASATPPPPAPPARPPRPRRRPGGWPSRTSDLPNAVQGAVIGGFCAGRAARRCSSRYVERYFAAIGDVWARAAPPRWRRASSSGSTRRCWSSPGRRRAHGRLPGRPGRARRRCAGCCSRAATASSARCAPAPATPPPAEPHAGARPASGAAAG